MDTNHFHEVRFTGGLQHEVCLLVESPQGDYEPHRVCAAQPEADCAHCYCPVCSYRIGEHPSRLLPRYFLDRVVEFYKKYPKEFCGKTTGVDVWDEAIVLLKKFFSSPSLERMKEMWEIRENGSVIETLRSFDDTDDLYHQDIGFWLDEVVSLVPNPDDKHQIEFWCQHISK